MKFMNKPAIDYFNDRADALAAQYNQLDRQKVHADLLANLPKGEGLRVLDIGAGYEVERNRAWSVISIAAGVVLTAAFWAALLLI